MDIDPFIYALLGGILPALVWLLFWLREDWRNPEPNRLILRTFLFGLLVIIFVVPLEKVVAIAFSTSLALQIFLWAAIEEAFKFFAAYAGGLHSREDNEPIDPLIYMLTAALGFAAMENALFILDPLMGSRIAESLVTGNMRFVGASLLHVVSSGLLGASLSYSFYQRRSHQIARGLQGLAGAVVFHAAFNLLVFYKSSEGIAAAFISVWVGVIALLWTFEHVKMLRAPGSRL